MKNICIYCVVLLYCSTLFAQKPIMEWENNIPTDILLQNGDLLNPVGTAGIRIYPTESVRGCLVAVEAFQTTHGTPRIIQFDSIGKIDLVRFIPPQFRDTSLMYHLYREGTFFEERPTVFSFHYLYSFRMPFFPATAVQTFSIAKQFNREPILHISIDTGMRRFNIINGMVLTKRKDLVTAISSRNFADSLYPIIHKTNNNGQLLYTDTLTPINEKELRGTDVYFQVVGIYPRREGTAVLMGVHRDSYQFRYSSKMQLRLVNDSLHEEAIFPFTSADIGAPDEFIIPVYFAEKGDNYIIVGNVTTKNRRIRPFVLEVNKQGAIIRSTIIETIGNVNAAAITPKGDVVIIGTRHIESNQSRFFLASLSDNLLQQVFVWGEEGIHELYDVAVSADNKIWITGMKEKVAYAACLPSSSVVSTEENTVAEYPLYPNPAKETIAIGVPPEFVGSEYVISDIYGRRCITGTATETLQFISVSNQASGVYIFNARTSNGKAYTRQFVISR